MITLKTHFREATRQLFANKLRAFLAVLGILVGTASVVAMVSIGELAEEQILAQFKNLGINLLSVSVYPLGDNQNANPEANLNIHSAENIVSASANIIEAAPYLSNYGSIVFQGHILSGSSVGVTPAMFHIAKLNIAKGRSLSFLDDFDYFCVLGQALAQKMHGYTHQSLIGQQVKIGSVIYTVVGILQKWPVNFFFDNDFNNSLLVPIHTAMGLQKNAHINSVSLRIGDTSLIAPTEKHIKAYINKHTLQQRVTIRSPKSLIDSMKKSSQTMTLLLGLIGSISLLVGGIGVMNIMLVSVAERHREIGIRLAIGARQKDIQLQFLVESITLSVFGGISGMILGVVITYFVALSFHWVFELFILPPIIGALVSIAVGVFFGFYPARQAAKLDPIQTLRSE